MPVRKRAEDEAVLPQVSVLETSLRGGPHDGQNVRIECVNTPCVIWLPKRPCKGDKVPIAQRGLPEFPACYERTGHCYQFIGWFK